MGVRRGFEMMRCNKGLFASFGAGMLLCAAHGLGQQAVGKQAGARQAATLDAGVPLHITTTRNAKMRVGAPVEGVLADPVWVYDRLVLPKGTPVRGTVTALEPLEGEDRLKARLNGDLTPLHTPVVRFTSVQLGRERLPVDAEGGVRQTETVRFAGRKKPSIGARLKGMVRDKWASVHDEVLAPGLGDRALRLFYNQLPYHPQSVWKGTDFVADLQQPATLRAPKQPVPVLVQGANLAGSLPPDTTVHARLVTALSSETAKQGEKITAVVTEPVLDAKHELVLPEGAKLEGTVLRAKPSRSLGRNGALHFTFREVQRQDEAAQRMYGTVTGATGAQAQNLTVDDEGNVQAQPDKNRFAAPLLLAVLAAAGHDDDGGAGQQVVGSNGLGLVGRVVAAAASSPNAAAGFGAYGFAKSVYFRFLRRGHPVTFPKDTPVEVEFSKR